MIRFRLKEIVSSLTSMYILMGVLAVGAAVATFVENDHGTEVARAYVYDSLWYEIVLTLTVMNLLAVAFKTHMYKRLLVFVFHTSFAVILVGAGLTRYFGHEGQVSIREGQTQGEVYVDGNLVPLPFSLQLQKFEMLRYPGSRSPSGYTSYITIYDKNEKHEVWVSVNAPIDYRGYRIFQASYLPDEEGTVLSINRDPGKEVTYLGYALLFMGLLLNIAHPKSRFRVLIRRINHSTIASVLLCGVVLHSEQAEASSLSPFIAQYLDDHREGSRELSEQFGRLMVQSRMGRIKPLDTLNREVLRKVTQSSSLYGMNHNQVVLGLLSRPNIWKKIPLIRVKSNRVKEKLEQSSKVKMVSFQAFFDTKGEYRLEQDVAQVSAMLPFERSEDEKEILKLDERVSIVLMVQKGTLLKIFPAPDDPSYSWYGFIRIWDHLSDDQTDALQDSSRSFIDAVFARNYNQASLHLEEMLHFQKRHGAEVYPDEFSITMELVYHHLNLFPKLMLIYLCLGFLGIFVAFYESLRQKQVCSWLSRSLSLCAVMLLIMHGTALAMRAYVSGHMPLSDTYESLIAIAFFSVAAGLCCARRSLFVSSSSLLMGGIFLFVAHLNSIDPEITNLVPVLKSLWLSIHVSVIISSYGFFGIACLLSFFSLILMAVPCTTCSISKQVRNLADLSEAYQILGLTLLVIGNFLGAIWANESWGRYWGWDPKETWAYIAIITYALVIHLRLLKAVYSEVLQATCSVLAFSTILMTYFGVNFYLSGKHSYATGDPILVPRWAIIMGSIVLVVIALAWVRQKRLGTRGRLDGVN
ncbi:MAG: cytochrome c biogenesis protein CcsA [Planctomycetes bacterium]|nr:cytochrome c biogenesis protein CcsA [Planctomycetota bacterium]